jgi:3,4-dihydroxy 2-butanone 4-phosphate synthase/GTP cyclohydrolase II
VLERAGQTEAAVDLARLAGLDPSGVICQVMNDDGTMARVPDLVRFCGRHALKLVSVADVIAYRCRHDRWVERIVATALPTAFGEFTAVGFRGVADGREHVALVKGDVRGADDVLVRVHEECVAGDVFHSLRCRCGARLDAAMAAIEREGRGVVLYLRPPASPDGVERLAAHLLDDLGVTSVRAMTPDLGAVQAN